MGVSDQQGDAVDDLTRIKDGISMICEALEDIDLRLNRLEEHRAKFEVMLINMEIERKDRRIIT